MTQPDETSPYRYLPEPVRAEDLTETIDVNSLPSRDADTEEREQMLRQAGAG